MKDQKAIMVRLGAAGDYDHFYGDDPALRGLDTIRPGAAAAHLVLTLDCRDPILGRLNLGNHAKFRFAYPYRYDDNFYAYKQVEDQIEFIDPRPADAAPDWPYPGCPDKFTPVPATLSLTRFPTDIVDSYPPTDPTHPQVAIYLGDHQRTTQDHHVVCPQCECDTRLLGRVPNQAYGAVEKIWDNDWVFSLFWYCDRCAVTITFNECD